MTEKESALWHRVSENEKKDIEIQAKKIMDNFHEALEKVEKAPESRVERDECAREEKEGSNPDEEFRKLMLKNAKSKNSDCIIAEKGAWT
jgi:hypothetical protein